MKIEITAEPKEIAALILAIQERQNLQISCHLDGKAIYSATHDTHAATPDR